LRPQLRQLRVTLEAVQELLVAVLLFLHGLGANTRKQHRQK
jgi:hypothetical protein